MDGKEIVKGDNGEGARHCKDLGRAARNGDQSRAAPIYTQDGTKGIKMAIGRKFPDGDSPIMRSFLMRRRPVSYRRII